MPRTERPLLAALVLATLAPLSRAQEPEVLVRTYDVRGLETVELERIPEGVDLRLHLASSFLHALEPRRYGVARERPPQLVPESGWSDLLLGALGEGWQYEVFDVDSVEGLLEVETDKATHAQIEEFLADLEAYALRTVQVDVHVLPTQELPRRTPTVLSAEDADALLASTTPVSSAHGYARFGHDVLIGAESVSATVLDYDVEVAQYKSGADPQVTALRHGTTIGANVTECPDGRLVLRAWGRRGLLGATRRIVMDPMGGAALDLPEMTTTLAVGSARLADGGALLLGQDWNPDGVWLIRVRVVGGPRPRTFVPLGAQVLQPLVVSPPVLGRAAPSGGWSRSDDETLESLGENQLQEPDDVLHRLFAARDRLRLEGSLARVGHAAYVRGDALRALVSDLIGEWEAARSAGTVEVDVRAGLVDGVRVSEVLAGRATAAALAESLGHRMAGACRPGDSLLVVGGAERCYLQDYDLEIAEGSAQSEPVIHALFEGASLWCRPAAMRTGGHLAWIRLECHVPAGGREHGVAAFGPTTETGEDSSTTSFTAESLIETPATARAGFRAVLPVPDGEWVLLGCQEMAGTGSHLVAVVRLTRR